jgi:DnaJ-domain-containing protein 1
MESIFKIIADSISKTFDAPVDDVLTAFQSTPATIEGHVVSDGKFFSYAINTKTNDIDIAHDSKLTKELNLYSDSLLSSMGVRVDSVQSPYNFAKGFLRLDLKCNSGHTPCGNACLPSGEKCRINAGSQVSANLKKSTGAKPLSAIAGGINALGKTASETAKHNLQQSANSLGSVKTKIEEVGEDRKKALEEKQKAEKREKRRKIAGHVINGVAAAAAVGLIAHAAERDHAAESRQRNQSSSHSQSQSSSKSHDEDDFHTEDPHEILGTNKNSTAQEIKSAYKQKARQYHPDLNPDKKTTRRMQKVNAAYAKVRKDSKFDSISDDWWTDLDIDEDIAKTLVAEAISQTFDAPVQVLTAHIKGDSISGCLLSEGFFRYDASEDAIAVEYLADATQELNEFSQGFLAARGVRTDSENTYEFAQGLLRLDVNCSAGNSPCGGRCLSKGQKCRKNGGGTKALVNKAGAKLRSPGNNHTALKVAAGAAALGAGIAAFRGRDEISKGVKEAKNILTGHKKEKTELVKNTRSEAQAIKSEAEKDPDLNLLLHATGTHKQVEKYAGLTDKETETIGGIAGSITGAAPAVKAVAKGVAKGLKKGSTVKKTPKSKPVDEKPPTETPTESSTDEPPTPKKRGRGRPPKNPAK